MPLHEWWITDFDDTGSLIAVRPHSDVSTEIPREHCPSHHSARTTNLTASVGGSLNSCAVLPTNNRVTVRDIVFRHHRSAALRAHFWSKASVAHVQ
jgi:hypothetical protein